MPPVTKVEPWLNSSVRVAHVALAFSSRALHVVLAAKSAACWSSFSQLGAPVTALRHSDRGVKTRPQRESSAASGRAHESTSPART